MCNKQTNYPNLIHKLPDAELGKLLGAAQSTEVTLWPKHVTYEGSSVMGILAEYRRRTLGAGNANAALVKETKADLVQTASRKRGEFSWEQVPGMAVDRIKSGRR